MAVFAYNPEAVKAWANSVVNYLNGGSESVSSCSRRFSEQIEKLVQPNVWTGAAAAKNYQNFMETHQAMIKFINSFGEAFEGAMNSINASVAQLEIANLGVDTNVASKFGSLSYEQISALSAENINKEVVRYDYATIISIGSALNSIVQELEGVKTGLNSKINELNNGSAIWDGNAAESSKESLLATLENNMKAVLEGLQVCINNISGAAEAAQMADTGR